MKESLGFILAGVAILLLKTPSVLSRTNKEFHSNCTQIEHFTCKNNQCIENAKVCNGIRDCVDGSDEENCEFHHVSCNATNYFRCKNNKCVHKSFLCNEMNDCGDYSDEINCTVAKVRSCSSDEWQCLDKKCIPKDFVCNDENDCADGSDETLGCSIHLECFTFKCNNRHCIPDEWRCDGNDDCNDNSDEINCESYIKPEECTLENGLFLCSDKKSCIKLKEVCDGKHQCPDMSDESIFCTSAVHSCDYFNCSHRCLQLPTGPKCICPDGYKNVDGKHCFDINECEIYGICDQICHNLPGSYKCYCNDNYQLQGDKKTCKATGGDAMMVFSSKTEISGYFLDSQIYFPLVKRLKHAVGVDYDGQYIYWTDIHAEHESIVRSLENGFDKELLVTSGLGIPEDLAVDWITGNIYFTDSSMHHIGVCTNNGIYCTVLVNRDIDKPRAIILNPAEGEMFWTDWGQKPEIARSKMDGSNDVSFVSNDILWPNGLALDYPNQRLYWVDAKHKTVESIRLDGTDRRVILEGIIKHPYSIAVFENRLYWSDWNTHSIQSCDKFTGKNHHTLVTKSNEYIYGMHVFHPVLKRNRKNPCLEARCSDICLLSGNNYTCACPQDKILNANKHTCSDNKKSQILIVGAKDTLIHIEHQQLGKHDVTALPTTVKEMGALAYNSYNQTLFISDLQAHKIVTLNLKTGRTDILPLENLGQVVAMDYDYVGNNLYWCDSEKATVEVLNLNSYSQKILLHDMDGEIPKSVALIPNEGVMFIAFSMESNSEFHIDRVFMDGTSRIHVIEQGLLGPISLTYDKDTHRVFWCDAGTGNIESTSIDGDDRHGFRSLQSSPISLTTLNEDLFWVNRYSKRVYWGRKQNSYNGQNKKITLDVPDDIEMLHLLSLMPQHVSSYHCRVNNGNCSHLCLPSLQNFFCACPLGMKLRDDNQTCYKPTQCDSGHLLCKKSNECILKSMRCDGRKDCEFGEDEENCAVQENCSDGQFKCANGACIDSKLVCNDHYDCTDRSDETACVKKQLCPVFHFKCTGGQCLSNQLVCDGIRDCQDGSDELNCATSACADNEFRCTSGSCIPKNWECDHHFDCIDLSDEHSGCAATKCTEGKFACDNGRCIDMSLRCDKGDDCGDNSDEVHCKEDKQNNICGINEYPCASNSSVCVPFDAKCNGTSECPHHEDEQGCSDCHTEEYECDNKKCIPTQWLCDSIDDCGDGSDESPEFCLHHINIDKKAHKTTPCHNGFQCKTGSCIDFSFVCNGEEDCYDGSDEHGACSSSCQRRDNPCSQICVKTPSGPVCQCKAGFELRGNGHSCSDIKECKQDPPVCGQICTETSGSFHCDCYDGYILTSDRKSCKSVGESMSMIFTVDNQIRKLSQLDNSLMLLYADETPKITGLDVSVPENYIYFSIEESSTMHRINLKSQTREYITQLGRPQKIALDWISNNVYYFDAESAQKSIRMCNFEEKLCVKILNLDLHSHVSAFALDAINRHIFFTTAQWLVFNSPSFVLYRCNLDGTNVKELLKSTVGYVNGLTFDLNKRLLYYVDQHLGRVHQINYDGQSEKVIISNLTRPVGLNLFEDHLYLLSSNGYMKKCRLYGQSRSCESFKLHVYSSNLFAIFQQSKQPKIENICQKHNCDHLCVPSETGPRCIGENGQEISQSSNKQQPKFSIHSQMHVVTVESHSSVTLIVAILIPLFVTLIGLGVFYIIRKKRIGRFDVSMRFYNPLYGFGTDGVSKPVLQPGQHEYSNPINFYMEDKQDTKKLIDE